MKRVLIQIVEIIVVPAYHPGVAYHVFVDVGFWDGPDYSTIAGVPRSRKDSSMVSWPA